MLQRFDSSPRGTAPIHTDNWSDGVAERACNPINGHAAPRDPVALVEINSARRERCSQFRAGLHAFVHLRVRLDDALMATLGS